MLSSSRHPYHSSRPSAALGLRLDACACMALSQAAWAPGWARTRMRSALWLLPVLAAAVASWVGVASPARVRFVDSVAGSSPGFGLGFATQLALPCVGWVGAASEGVVWFLVVGPWAGEEAGRL
jgi:hypothetical protein